jgi:Tfp pilus assembly protein PilF
LVEFWGTATKEVRDRLVAEALEGEPPDQTSGAGRKLLIAAAVVGLVVAVWALGRPPAAEDEAPTSTAATATTVTEDSSADYAARAAELEAVLAAEPSNTDAMLELGVAYFNTGQIERAAAQWNKVAELAPDSAAAWFNLGFYHLSSDPPDAELAKAAWEKVIELAPGSDSALTAAKHLEALNASLEASATPSAAAQDP